MILEANNCNVCRVGRQTGGPGEPAPPPQPTGWPAAAEPGRAGVPDEVQCNLWRIPSFSREAHLFVLSRLLPDEMRPTQL